MPSEAILGDGNGGSSAVTMYWFRASTTVWMGSCARNGLAKGEQINAEYAEAGRRVRCEYQRMPETRDRAFVTDGNPAHTYVFPHLRGFIPDGVEGV